MVWATLVRTISRTTFSKKWFEDRHLDFYAQKARKEGFRARSCYKLMEIDEKHNILHRNSVVVELGSAPGGWTQVAAKKVKTQHGGLIVALDRSEMDPVEGAIVLQMDFIKDDRKRLHDLLVGKLVDVVLSDMAPNTSGNTTVDHANSLELNELALGFALEYLQSNRKNAFLTKLFQGEGEPEFRSTLKAHFHRVIAIKPESSRSTSKEIFYLCLNKK